MTSVDIGGSALASSIAFTGRLACMSRAEAFDVVRQRGGTPSPAVTKRTQVLIVGELGWPLLDDGRPSNKLSRAKPKRLCERLRAPIRHLPKLGTISPTCWMIRDAPKRLSNACAR